jgi:hypothetical protein
MMMTAEIGEILNAGCMMLLSVGYVHDPLSAPPHVPIRKLGVGKGLHVCV